MLIAITGKAGAGKDSAANALIRYRFFTRLAFADPLKDSCMFKFGLSKNDVYTQEGKKRFVPEWGLTVGEILQQEGTEGTKGFWGDDFWARRWGMDYRAALEQGLTNIVVTDCRFDLEAEVIKNLGGKIIKIVRPEKPELEGRDPNHASERGISSQFIDCTIINDGTVKDLHVQILNRVRDWEEGK